MNPDDVLNDTIGILSKELTYDTAVYASTLANTFPIGAVTVANGGTTGISAITTAPSIDDILDECIMNRVAIDHKVTAQELLKLQEVAPDYASEIKENIAKNLARDIAKKVKYTKKHDKDTDVHHFIGRVWVFTDEELKELLKGKNVY
jgi:hypothetical protein